MKRSIFILSLFILTLNVFAQNTKFDTLISARWNGRAWQNNDKVINTYDEGCRLHTALIQGWDSSAGSWVNNTFNTYSYLSGEYVSGLVSQTWNTATSSWNDNVRQTFTYDASFKLLSAVLENWFFGQWLPFVSTTYTYDTDNYLDSELLQLGAGGYLQNTSLSIYTNNNDGTRQQIISQNWNTTTSSWDNFLKETHTYNPDKTLNQATIDLWNSTTSAWEKNQEKTYSYSGTGKLLNFLTEGWQANQWVNQALATYTYDTNGFLANFLEQGWDGNDWINGQQNTYINNNDGSVHQHVIQEWDTNTNAWVNNSQEIFSYAASCVLPLKLLAFAATKNDNIVNLSWQTAEEINTAYFTIQRSMNGVNFSNLGNVSAKGNSTGVTNYVYADNVEKVAGDKIYYRLKEVDKDGLFTYSKIIPVTLTAYTNALKIYPNPAKDQLFVLFKLQQNTSKADLHIIDISGKTVYSQPVSKNQGNNITAINISLLSKGMYSILLITDAGIQNRQFLKQ